MARMDDIAKRVAAAAPEVAAENLANHLAVLQDNRFDVLNRAGGELQKVDIEIAGIERSLLDLVRRSPDTASEIVNAMKRGGVNTGKMNSRLVDALEQTTSTTLSPPPWRVKNVKWELFRDV